MHISDLCFHVRRGEQLTCEVDRLYVDEEVFSVRISGTAHGTEIVLFLTEAQLDQFVNEITFANKNKGGEDAS